MAVGCWHSNLDLIYLLYPHNSKYNLRLYTSFEINLGWDQQLYLDLSIHPSIHPPCLRIRPRPSPSLTPSPSTRELTSRTGSRTPRPKQGTNVPNTTVLVPSALWPPTLSGHSFPRTSPTPPTGYPCSSHLGHARSTCQQRCCCGRLPQQGRGDQAPGFVPSPLPYWSAWAKPTVIS